MKHLHLFLEENIFTNSPKKSVFKGDFLGGKKNQLIKLVDIYHLFHKSRFLQLSLGTECFVSHLKKYKHTNTFYV